MERMNPFDVPHKGLRHALSQLSLQAGKINYDDHNAVELLCQLGRDVFHLIAIHADDEDEVTLAELAKRCPGAAEHDHEEHERIHALQEKLVACMEQLHHLSGRNENIRSDAREFYLAFSEFHAVFLQHMAEEERVTLPLLLESFSDEELAAHRGTIMAKHPPEMLFSWFRFVIPAQSTGESAGLLAGFRRMVSADVFAKAMDEIKAHLPENDLLSLQRALG